MNVQLQCLNHGPMGTFSPDGAVGAIREHFTRSDGNGCKRFFGAELARHQISYALRNSAGKAVHGPIDISRA